MPLHPVIQSTCVEYFGETKVIRGNKQLVGNRCDKCPLRAPCLKWGAKPARTLEELRQNGEAFADEALAILAEGK